MHQNFTKTEANTRHSWYQGTKYAMKKLPACSKGKRLT
jgi:hypothetical protein